MIVDMFIKALVSQWPSAIAALLLGYVAWNIRGFRDRFVAVEEKVGALEGKTTTMQGSIDKIKGRIGMNGASIILFLLLFRGCGLPAFAQEWTPEMERIAVATEIKFDLPHGICRAFALQESNYQPFAERVEANYVEKSGAYAARIRAEAYSFAKANKWQPSFLTEVYQRGKSVTMFQIMGVNMRDMGYQNPFLNYISLTDQFYYFGVFISRLFKKYKGNVASVASEYNGGYGAVRYKEKNGQYRNQPYVNNILKNLAKFSTSG